MFALRNPLRPPRVVHAHCDIPCGVYDPEQARIEAESCLKILEKYEASDDAHFRARCIHVKEERAELVKHHLDVLWHDYFKPEHVEKFPTLHETFWNASKQASKVKQTLDKGEAQKLLHLIDEIDRAWIDSGGPEKTRVNGRPGVRVGATA
jgi:nickel superoxide dismutase